MFDNVLFLFPTRVLYLNSYQVLKLFYKQFYNCLTRKQEKGIECFLSSNWSVIKYTRNNTSLRNLEDKLVSVHKEATPARIKLFRLAQFCGDYPGTVSPVSYIHG